MVAGVEGLAPGGLDAHGVDRDVGAEAAGELADRVNNLLLREILGADGVGRAELASGFQLGLVDVHGDDLGRARQLGTRNGSHANAAATKDSDGLAELDIAGIHGRAEARHDAAAQQASGSRVGVFHLGALALVDQGLLSEGTDAQRRGELGAVLEGHLLGGVVGIEAVLWLALLAGAALAAHGAPVQNDEVAFLHVGDRRTYSLHYACGLVAEQEGEGVFNIAIAVGKVGVAHTAGLDAHDDIVRAGVRNDNVDGFDFRTLGTGDNSFYSHAPERTDIFKTGALLKTLFKSGR